MARVIVLSDNTADIPKSLIDELDIKVIPSYVVMGENTFREGIELSTTDLYTRMKEMKVIPKTSQPTLADFMQIYDKLSQDGSSIISIHMSSQMSGTSQTAMIAREALPDRDITVIDSKQMSLALGMVVVAAARAAKEGKTKDEVIERANAVMEQIQTYFIVDTLEYLHRGGRIGKAQSLVGNILHIKPILTLKDGFIAPFENNRGKTKALRRIIGIAKEYQAQKGPLICGIAHANCPEDALQFKEMVSAEIDCQEFIFSEICAVIGVHCGPGTMALFFY